MPIVNAAQMPREAGEGERLEETERRMTRAEAGRKGGYATKRRYGGEYFSRIGRLGGQKGGESTKRRYGVDFYKAIGRKGGARRRGQAPPEPPTSSR
jgi:hypothetical protein